MPTDATEPVVIPLDVWRRAEILESLRSRDIGRLFRLTRQHTGASQTRIGIAVNLSQGKISAIMKGSMQVTSLEVIERIAEGLNMPDPARVALGLAPKNPFPRPHIEPEHSPSGREEPDLPTRYLASLTGASSRPVISGLRHVLAGHIQAEAIMGPPLLIDAATSHIPLMGHVCRMTRGADHTEALSLASELLEFCGWLHQDLGKFTQAIMWTNKALDYAMELGDQRVISYILMRKSAIATAVGDHGHGLGLANAALATPEALTSRLRAVILRTRATANAHLGETIDSARDSEHALDEAIAGLRQTDSDRAPYCTPAYIAMETGATRLLLGSPASAIPIFEASRSQWTPASQARDHALFLARMATAYAMAGERDQACAVAEEAIPQIQALRSSRVAGQLSALRTQLSRWSAEQPVADLLTRLDPLAESFLPAPRSPEGER